MSRDPCHSVEQLARHYQDVADGRAHPGRESDQSEPEPIGWRSGALETYRRCAADLRQLAEELGRDEEAREFAASGLVVASGAPWMPLEIRRGLSEARHYLDGRAVRRGDLLELLLPGGRVLRGRYEWDSDSGDPLERSPALVIEVAGGTWGEVDAFLHLPPEARLRWPPEAA